MASSHGVIAVFDAGTMSADIAQVATSPGVQVFLQKVRRCFAEWLITKHNHSRPAATPVARSHSRDSGNPSQPDGLPRHTARGLAEACKNSVAGRPR